MTKKTFRKPGIKLQTMIPVQKAKKSIIFRTYEKAGSSSIKSPSHTHTIAPLLPSLSLCPRCWVVFWGSKRWRGEAEYYSPCSKKRWRNKRGLPLQVEGGGEGDINFICLPSPLFPHCWLGVRKKEERGALIQEQSLCVAMQSKKVFLGNRRRCVGINW